LGDHFAVLRGTTTTTSGFLPATDGTNGKPPVPPNAGRHTMASEASELAAILDAVKPGWRGDGLVNWLNQKVSDGKTPEDRAKATVVPRV
jgi:hypothetical protein